MKILAVGDIHTKLWIIDRVEKIIDNYDAIIFVGDYADDWDARPVDTLATWEKLKNLQDKYGNQVNLVVGNHDYIYLHKTPTISSGYNRITQLMLDASENKDLKEWLLSLPEMLEIDKVLYSHAGLTKEWDKAEYWNDYSPIWARPGNVEYGQIVKGGAQVFGHTPSRTCWEVQPNIWCIDTFSTLPDGTPIGDGTVLEIINGKQFNKIELSE